MRAPRLHITSALRNGARRGMTLVELLAAIVLTGIMATVGTAAFGTIVDKRAQIRTATIEAERAAALRELLRTWVVAGTIQLQIGGGPRGLGNNVASRGARTVSGVSAAVTSGDELTFTTTAPTPAFSMQTRVRLFVDDDENTPETGLTIEFQANTAMPLQRLQLDSTIKVMTVEILDRRTNRWFPSREAATVQPLAVRLTLSAPEGETLPALLQLPFVFRIGDASAPVAGQ